MLILQRKAGQSLVIGEDITVQVVSVDGTRVRLAISAPEDVPILRSELVTATAANRDSAMEETTPAELLDLLGGVLDHKREGHGTPSKTEPPVPPERKED
ncbi:MAG: carbon storage regulator [Clostridiales bacterium]|nr:carbon storage regulator [Clostridiales bacterium]